MEIEIWLDYACPYCYVDFTRLQKVLKEMDLPKLIKINIHAAQIDPGAPKHSALTTGEMLIKKDNLTEKEVKQRFEGIKELGQKAGLDIKYADTKNTNTMDAHRLVQWVEHELHKPNEAIKLADLLFEAYFYDGVELANHEVLIDRAKKVGLEHKKVEKFLRGDEYRDLVIEQENILEDRNIDSVPYMVINNKAYTGIQEPEVIKEAINAGFYAKSK